MVTWCFAKCIAISVNHELRLEGRCHWRKHGTKLPSLHADPGPPNRVSGELLQRLADEFLRVSGAAANHFASRRLQQFRHRPILLACSWRSEPLRHFQSERFFTGESE